MKSAKVFFKKLFAGGLSLQPFGDDLCSAAISSQIKFDKLVKT